MKCLFGRVLTQIFSSARDKSPGFPVFISSKKQRELVQIIFCYHSTLILAVEWHFGIPWDFFQHYTFCVHELLLLHITNLYEFSLELRGQLS